MIFDPMTFDRSFGERCRENRSLLGLSQDGVCDLLSRLGVIITQVNYSRVEMGTRPVRLFEAVALAEVLNIDLTSFFVSDAHGVAAFALALKGGDGNP